MSICAKSTCINRQLINFPRSFSTVPNKSPGTERSKRVFPHRKHLIGFPEPVRHPTHTHTHIHVHTRAPAATDRVAFTSRESHPRLPGYITKHYARRAPAYVKHELQSHLQLWSCVFLDGPRIWSFTGSRSERVLSVTWRVLQFGSALPDQNQEFSPEVSISVCFL